MFSLDKSFQIGLFIGLLVKQQELIDMQQQLIEAQKQVIELNSKLQQLTPQKLDRDGHWHEVAPDKRSAFHPAESNDLQTLQRYSDWMTEFGRKYLKPYIALEAYGEVMTHLQRDVTKKLAKLETDAQFKSHLETMQRIDEAIEATTTETAARFLATTPQTRQRKNR